MRVHTSTIEERVKDYISTNFTTSREWESVYGYKQRLTRCVGYCYEAELAVWFEEMGYKIAYLKDSKRLLVKAKLGKYRKVEPDYWHDMYPDWDVHRELPEEYGVGLLPEKIHRYFPRDEY
ncbi:MAG: hypothetical protein QNJ63_29375 [Calothrix sp. MO_192.B10]|nr:hypothetical protein [Calothrix sp. MO_192.B10]